MADSDFNDEVMRLVSKMDDDDHKENVQRLAQVYRKLRDNPERLRAIEALLAGRSAAAEMPSEPAQPQAPATGDILPVFSTGGQYLGTMNRALVAHDSRYALSSRGRGQEVIVDLQDATPSDTVPGATAAVPVPGTSGALSGVPATEQYPLYDADSNRKGMCTEADAIRHRYREIRDAQGNVAAYQEEPPKGWHLRPRKAK